MNFRIFHYSNFPNIFSKQKSKIYFQRIYISKERKNKYFQRLYCFLYSNSKYKIREARRRSLDQVRLLIFA